MRPTITMAYTVAIASAKKHVFNGQAKDCVDRPIQSEGPFQEASYDICTPRLHLHFSLSLSPVPTDSHCLRPIFLTAFDSPLGYLKRGWVLNEENNCNAGLMRHIATVFLVTSLGQDSTKCYFLSTKNKSPVCPTARCRPGLAVTGRLAF